MNTILISYSEPRLCLPFFEHVTNPNFHILVTNEDMRRLYLNQNEYIDIDNVDKLLKDPSIIIRWGNRTKLSDKHIVYNTGKAIRSVSDKKNARVIMDNNNIRTIEIANNIEDVTLLDYPVIIRPLKHERGNNFHVCQNPNGALRVISRHFTSFNDCYVSSYFPRTNEYRVYCAHNKILYLQEKAGIENFNIINDDIKDINRLDWNTIPWDTIASSEILTEICKESIDATSLFGLDFSAVDVLYDRRSNNFVICEINTMPELLDYGFSRFALYFNMLIDFSNSNNKRLSRKTHTENENQEILWRNNFSIRSEN